MSTNLDIAVTLKAIDQLSGPVRQATDAVKGLGRAAQLGQQMGAAGQQMSMVGGLAQQGAQQISSALRGPIEAAADFEAGMSRVGALAKLTGAQGAADLAALTAQAKELGNSTKYSATQAADAMGYLAMAGFQADQILTAMPSTLAMAAAGAVDLADAADISSNILSGFGLAADQMPRVADVLTATFTSSNTDLRMLGETMKYMAPIAKEFGMSLEDSAAAAGILGNSGIQASQAGTTLRSMLTRLAAPPKEAADALKALGVRTTDVATGNMRPFADILRDVAQATEHMGSGERLGYIKEIFGQIASSGAATLLANGQSLEAFMEALDNAGGTAERVASQMQDNFRGAETAFRSATEGLHIAIGDKLLPDLTSLTQWSTEVVRSLTGWVEAHPEITRIAAGITAVVGGLVGTAATASLAGGALLTFGGYGLQALSAVAQTAGRVPAALRAATTAARALSLALVASPAGLMISVLAGGALLVYRYWQPIAAFFRGLWRGLEAGWASVDTALGNLAQAVRPVTDLLGGPMETLGVWVRDHIGWFEDLLEPVKYTVGELDRVGSAGERIGRLVGQGIATAVQTVADWLSWLRERIARDWRHIRAHLVLPDITLPTLRWSDLRASGAALMTTIADGIRDGAQYLWDAVRDVLAVVRDYLPFSPARIGPLRDILIAGAALMTTIAAGVIAAGGDLVGAVGEAVRDGLSAIGRWIGSWRWPDLPDIDWTTIARDAGRGVLRGLADLADDARAAGARLMREVSAGAVAVAGTLSDQVRAAVTGLADLSRSDVAAAVRDVAARLRTVWTDLLASVSGSALVQTIAAGIRSAAAQAWDALVWVLQELRSYLPFSDARQGPLSTLSASGRAIPATLAMGVADGASGLLTVMRAALAPITDALGGLIDAAADAADWIGRHMANAWQAVRDVARGWGAQSQAWAPFPGFDLWKPQIEYLKGAWDGMASGMSAASGAMETLKTAANDLWQVISPLTEAGVLAGLETAELPELPSLVGSAAAATVAAGGTMRAAGGAAPAPAGAIEPGTGRLANPAPPARVGANRMATQAKKTADAIKALRNEGQYLGEVLGGTVANAFATVVASIKWSAKVIRWAKDAVVAAVDAFDRLYTAIAELPAVKTLSGWLGGVFGVGSAQAAQLTAEEWRLALDQVAQGSQAAGDGLDRYRDAIRQAQSAGEPATEELRRYKEAIILAKQQAQGGIGVSSVIGEITSMDEILGTAIGSMAVLWGIGKIARFVRRFRGMFRAIQGGWAVVRGTGRAAVLIGRDIGRVAGRAVAAARWAGPQIAAAARWAWPRVAAVARLAGVAMRGAWRGAVSAARWAKPHLLSASRAAWGGIRRGVLAAGTAMRDIPGLARQAGSALRQMAKPDRAQVMADAWSLARDRARQYGGSVRSHIGPAMRDSWKQSKGLGGAIRNVEEALGSLARTKAGAAITGVLAPALRSLRAALGGKAAMAHPLIAVAAAATALGVAAYTYWEPMKKWVAGFFAGLQAAVEPLAPVFEALGGALSFLDPLFAPIKAGFEALGKALEWVFNLFGGAGIDRVAGTAEHMALGEAAGRAVGAWIQGILDSIGDAVAAGQALLGAIGDGILSAARIPYDAVVSVFTAVRNLLPFSDAREGPLSTLTASGRALVTTMADAIVSVGSVLYDAGVGLIGSLWRGMQAIWGQLSQWFVSQLSGMLHWLPDIVREKLGFEAEIDLTPRVVLDAAEVERQARDHARVQMAGWDMGQSRQSILGIGESEEEFQARREAARQDYYRTKIAELRAANEAARAHNAEIERLQARTRGDTSAATVAAAVAAARTSVPVVPRPELPALPRIEGGPAARTDGGGTGRSAAAGSGETGRPVIQVTYSPTVTIEGGAGQLDIQALLSSHADELVELIERTLDRRRRLAY